MTYYESLTIIGLAGALWFFAYHHGFYRAHARLIPELSDMRTRLARIKALDALHAALSRPSEAQIRAIAERYAERIGNYALCEPPDEIVIEAIREALDLREENHP